MPFGGLLTTSLIGAGGSLLGGLFGSNAAKKAAEVQANATKYAADKQGQAAADALGFQGQVYADQRAQNEPFLRSGTNAVLALNDMMQNPNSDLRQGFDGQAFGENFKGDPGFDFRMKQGELALSRSAATKGAGLSGGAQKSLTRYAQDYGSNEYDRAYNRAQGTFNTNNTNQFNRFAALAGIGQTAVGTGAAEGSQAAAANTGTLLDTARIQGDLATQGANARASGYVGSANSWQNAFGGLTNAAQFLSLSQLLKQQRGPNNPIYQNNPLGNGQYGAGPVQLEFPELGV